MCKFFCDTKKLNTRDFDLVQLLNQFEVKLNNKENFKGNKGIDSSISSLPFYFLRRG